MLARSESDAEFFGRRAMEEARAAAAATCAAAGAAHRRMAVAYAARLREDQVATAAFQDLLVDRDGEDGPAAADATHGARQD